MVERGPRALEPERDSHKSHLLKPPLLHFPFAGGGSTLLGVGFPDAWEPSKAPTLVTPWRRDSPKGWSSEPPPPLPRSCGSLRLRSGSTSFLRMERAEGCLLLGCVIEKVRDHLAGWVRLWESELSRVGWVRLEPALEGEVLTYPRPHPKVRAGLGPRLGFCTGVRPPPPCAPSFRE